MGAIFQYGGRAHLYFLFLKTAILQYGCYSALFKHNLTFYNMATIFKLYPKFKVRHFKIITQLLQYVCYCALLKL